MIKRTLILAGLLAGLAGVGVADDASVIRALQNASTRLSPQVTAVLNQQQGQIDPKCKLGTLAMERVTVVDTPAFNLDGMPERGSWEVRYTSTACKRTVTRTVAFKGGVKGVALEAGVPGETQAYGALANDVWRAFKQAAVRARPGCTDMRLRETSIVEAPRDAKSIWREAWVGQVCGRDLGQIVSFYPNAKGTLFRMALPDEVLPDKDLKPLYR